MLRWKPVDSPMNFNTKIGNTRGYLVSNEGLRLIEKLNTLQLSNLIFPLQLVW